MQLEPTLALKDLVGRDFTCACGRTHPVALDEVEIGPGAIGALTGIIEKHGMHSVFIVCDPVTAKIAGGSVERAAAASGARTKLHVLGHLGYDESTIGELVFSVPADADLLIAVGTGSINDMCRFTAYKLRIPYYIVATGAPMDGFAASIAVMNINNMKTTVPARSPRAVIGDTDVLKNAPMKMTVAGVGDMLGKYSSLSDWKLTRIITGEYYCPTVAAIMENCLADVMDDVRRIKNREADVNGELLNCLVLSGVVMGMVGNSRPASGCEHHMSHFWETILRQRGTEPAYHGLQVAVGTVMVLKFAGIFRREKPDFDRARAAARAYDKTAWEETMRRVYGPAAQGVIDMENEADKNGTEGRLARIDSMEAHWEEICDTLASLPEADHIINILRELGSPYLPSQIGIDDDLLKQTFLYCKEMRARYTLFQAAWDLDVLDGYSDLAIAWAKGLAT